MVKSFSKIVSLISLVVLFTAGIAEDVSNAFKAGNSAQLATYFGETVDLTIVDEDNLYPKGEAQKKLAAFFKAHPVTDFKVLHEGESKKGLKYAIGSLTTSNGNFRVSYYFNTKDSNMLLQQIIIDSE